MATLQSGKCFTVPTFFGMCCRSKYGGVFCSCVDSVWAWSVWNLGEFFHRFLGLIAPGWVCRFPLEFPLNSHEFFSLEFPNELGWFHNVSHDISQCRPGERWRPRGPFKRSHLCLGRVPACESRSLLDGGAFHSLCGGLALSWRWVPSRASPWLWVLKSRTAGVLALFSEAIFCL